MTPNKANARPLLAIIAGKGSLPRDIYAACRSRGREAFIIALRGVTEAQFIGDAPHQWVHLGAMDRTMTVLRERGAQEVVFAGPVKRPSLTSLRLDGRALKMMAAWRKSDDALGDDKLLSMIIGALEEEGYRVIGIDDVLAKILAPTGRLGVHGPDLEATADIAFACRAARALGALDIGQAVVVQQGMVLAVEAIEGTDAMLKRAQDLRRAGPGGVLVKLKKPGQEARADLPTIGVTTVNGAKAAGLKGIAIESGATLVVDKAAVIAAADSAGLFIIGISPDDP